MFVVVNHGEHADLPTHQECQYSFTSAGSDTFEIRPDLMHSIEGAEVSMRGWYTIGVHAHDNINYTIAVTNSEVSIAILHKGIPLVYKHTDPSLDAPVFSYRHTSNESFMIELDEEYGFAHIMANSLKTKEEEATAAVHIPSPDSSNDFSSYRSPNRLVLKVSNKSAEFCSDCTYLIAVTGNDKYMGIVRVSIDGHTTATSTSLLMLSRPVSTQINEFEDKFYKFVPSNDDPIEFDLNTLSGFATFSISCSQQKEDGSIRPGDLIYSGDSNSSYFLFDTDNASFKVGSAFYVTIKSDVPTRVVISISHLSDYKMISDATPLSVTLRAEKSVFYYLIDPAQTEAKIILEAIPEDDGAQFEIFVYKKALELTPAQDEGESHEHHSKLPVWMVAEAEIVEKAD